MSDEQNTATEARPKSGMMGKLMIAGFMGLVVGVESLLAYMFIPSAEDLKPLIRDGIRESLPDAVGHDMMNGGEDTKSMVEVDLGQYGITVAQPGSSTVLRIDFHLYGTVLEEQKNQLVAAYERHMHRFRDQIHYEIRNSEPSDLADPALGLIKRRILEKSNALFDEPLLRSVLFSQFSVLEQ